MSAEIIREKLSVPNSMRIFWVAQAFRHGWSVEDIYQATGVPGADRALVSGHRPLVPEQHQAAGGFLPASLRGYRAWGRLDNPLAKLDKEPAEKSKAMGIFR